MVQKPPIVRGDQPKTGSKQRFRLVEGSGWFDAPRITPPFDCPPHTDVGVPRLYRYQPTRCAAVRGVHGPSSGTFVSVRATGSIHPSHYLRASVGRVHRSPRVSKRLAPSQRLPPPLRPPQPLLRQGLGSARIARLSMTQAQCATSATRRVRCDTHGLTSCSFC
jgi:hypothetical protein